MQIAVLFPLKDIKRSSECSDKADRGTREGAVFESALPFSAFSRITALSLSAIFPYSVALRLSSFLPHGPFIPDLLFCSLYDTELSARNTKQNWDRFSTPHRSLCPLARVHCAAHPFCTSGLCPHISSVSMFPLCKLWNTHIWTHWPGSINFTTITIPIKQDVCERHCTFMQN